MQMMTISLCLRTSPALVAAHRSSHHIRVEWQAKVRVQNDRRA